MLARRTLILLAVAGCAAIGATGGYAISSLSGIPDSQGVFHACVNDASGTLKLVSSDGDCQSGWSKIFWSQTGPQGPQGVEGPPGLSDAFSIERSNEFAIPVGPSYATMLTLADIPAGKYVVLGNIVVDNLNSPGTIPVNCALASSAESSAPYSARVDPFNASVGGAPIASGASVQTIAITFTTVLASPGDIRLVCQSNTGNGFTANASRRQITAIKVSNLRQDSTP